MTRRFRYKSTGDEERTISKVKRVIGTSNKEVAGILKLFYSAIVEIEDGILLVRDTKTAEACKVIENTQRDLNIALMNEIALICERLGIDAIEVIEAAATKWNFVKYLPGPGVGGHCLPHDPYYLTSKAKELGYLVNYGRGSACSSLVTYLMGIHEIDPIKTGLYFERFLNESRGIKMKVF